MSIDTHILAREFTRASAPMAHGLLWGALRSKEVQRASMGDPQRGKGTTLYNIVAEIFYFHENPIFLDFNVKCFGLPAGTEFVVVEDASCVDTNAIILKGTTVLTYKPKLVDRPFSGSLFGIEVRRGHRSLCASIHLHSVGN